MNAKVDRVSWKILAGHAPHLMQCLERKNSTRHKIMTYGTTVLWQTQLLVIINTGPQGSSVSGSVKKRDSMHRRAEGVPKSQDRLLKGHETWAGMIPHAN